MWDSEVLCIMDINSRAQRYVWLDFSFGLHYKYKECGVSEQRSLSFMERQAGFSMCSPRGVSDLLPFGAVKVWLSRPGMFKPCTFQRKVWPLTGSWETSSKTLQYPIWQGCRCLPVAWNPTRWLILTLWWFMVEVLALLYQFDLWRHWRLRNEGQPQGCFMPMCYLYWVGEVNWKLVFGFCWFSFVSFYCG